jgi:hypothetical protein
MTADLALAELARTLYHRIVQETSLHAALKAWYAQPGDLLETPVDGYVVDIVRGDLLIEIQTRNFSALKAKLDRLLADHPVRLVYPLAHERWILRVAADGQTVLARRKSPRRGGLEHLFTELVRLPNLVAHPNFTLEVLFIQEEQIWRNDGRGSWRRKHWSIADRRLLGVLESRQLATPQDFLDLLPPGLPQPFTSAELAQALGRPSHLAHKMVYCLRAMGVIETVGKRGRAWLYRAL